VAGAEVLQTLDEIRSNGGLGVGHGMVSPGNGLHWQRMIAGSGAVGDKALAIGLPAYDRYWLLPG
jgi:hypothetical protein